MDGNVERIIKRIFLLKEDFENLIKKKPFVIQKDQMIMPKL